MISRYKKLAGVAGLLTLLAVSLASAQGGFGPNGRSAGGSGTGNVAGAASSVDSNFPSFSGTTGKILQDSGFNSASFAPPGTGIFVTGGISPSMADFNNGCKSLTIDGASQTINLPALSAPGGGGCYTITTPFNQPVTVHPAGSDLINGVNANVTVAANTTAFVTASATLGWGVPIGAAAGALTVGTSTLASGTTGRVLYDNGGVLGEYTFTGTAGSVVLSVSPALTGSPTVPTQAANDNSTKASSTAYVATAISNLLATVNAWTKPQSCTPVALTISTTTFTPNGTSCNYEITLTGADTLANPSPAFVAGQDGTFKICQDGTGGRTITSYGSIYWAAGGVATLTLTATASKCDLFAYHTDIALNVWLVPSAANGSH